MPSLTGSTPPSDVAYNESTWNANLDAPTKNVVRDKIEAVVASIPAAPYLVYTALLTQSGTDAPVATVLQNTLGGTVVWSYNSAGLYSATLAGVFTLNKTIGFSAGALNNGSSRMGQVRFNYTINYVDLRVTASDSETLSDEYLTNTSIEIRVYP